MFSLPVFCSSPPISITQPRLTPPSLTVSRNLQYPPPPAPSTCWSRWLIAPPDPQKLPRFFPPRRMNPAEPSPPSEINYLMRRGFLKIPSVKCGANRFIHVPTPPSAIVPHSIHIKAARGRDSSSAELVCQHKLKNKKKLALNASVPSASVMETESDGKVKWRGGGGANGD